MGSYTPIYSHDTDVYNLEGFSPQVVDYSYLKNLGVKVDPDETTLAALEKGSALFKDRLLKGNLIPRPRYEEIPSPTRSTLCSAVESAASIAW